MPRTILFSIATAVVFVAQSASADDKTKCKEGAEFIKAEIAKKPAKPVLDKLQKALDTVDQETIEGDWDECVAAVNKARRALHK